jgi:hypothetical protein
MDANVHDLVKETTATTGAGLTLTLIEATGFARFSEAESVGNTVYYVLRNGDNAEIGIGTVQATNTFDRTTPITTLVSGTYDTTSPAKITLVGDSTIAIAPTAAALLDAADEYTLPAIALIPNSGTIVDVFIYDTSKDTDGGQWRQRTSHTSWYNETLSTATRGATKEFPAVALIVAEAATVTIYDMTDSAIPMWMVFTWTTLYNLLGYGARSKNSIEMLNGVMVTAATTDGSHKLNFVTEKGYRYTEFGIFLTGDSVENRGVSTSTAYPLIDAGQDIVNSTVNDIAMTVLPNAPIDTETGLQIPTIAVATSGGASVITDGGDVWDSSDTNSKTYIAFSSDNSIITNNSTLTRYYRSVPVSDIVADGWGIGGATSYSDVTAVALLAGIGGIVIDGHHAGVLGLNQLKENLTTTAEGMVAYTTTDYTSGWMHGDIKGAWLADTDATDLVGTELVTNGDFPTDTSGWVASVSSGNVPALSVVSNQLRITADGTSSVIPSAEQSITTVVGAEYLLSVDMTYGAAAMDVTVGSTSLGTELLDYAPDLTVGSTTVIQSFIATTTTSYINLRLVSSSVSVTGDFDNVTVRLADQDRSVNDNGLQVFGTVTKTAVATSAELMAYSGFSASNYLEQPYNADLDFGTGDFYVMGWFKVLGTTLVRSCYVRDSTVSAQAILAYVNITTSTFNFRLDDNITPINCESTTVVDDDTWRFFAGTLTGGLMSNYINGVLENTSAASGLATMTNTAATTKIGVDAALGNPAQNSSLALWRIGAGAPSAAQIKEIYESERHLFQDNADCTLDGTSDAVLALAYDESTDLLHASNATNRSVFKGLQRVDSVAETSTTSISAVNGSVGIGA